MGGGKQPIKLNLAWGSDKISDSISNAPEYSEVVRSEVANTGELKSKCQRTLKTTVSQELPRWRKPPHLISMQIRRLIMVKSMQTQELF